MSDLCLGLILLIACTPTHADEAFVGYGIGIFNDASYNVGQMKVGDLGYRHFLFDGVYWQNKVGYWGEGSPDLSRSSSGFISSGLGLEMDLQPFELRSGYGLAAITSPDSQLGAVFPQFNGDLYAGFRDKKGDGIGLEYNHISCASFCSPNLGRDFIMIQLSQKW